MASHRLMQHIGLRFGSNVSEALYDRLNVYHFTEGHALNDEPRLARTASKTISEALSAGGAPRQRRGMSEEEVLEFLRRSEGREEVESALSALRRIGVRRGIPKIVIEGGSSVVDGVAGVETFEHIFREIEERGYVERGPVFADILGVGDEIIWKSGHANRAVANEG